MSKLVVVVPVGRRAAGRAVLLGNDGRVRLPPFRVVATASGLAAARHGNPDRSSRKPFGDTPAGSYVIAGALPPDPRARSGDDGLLGAIVLAPVGGDALEALRAGRTRFLLHGGPADASGSLRSTFGGLRVSDADLALLIAAINDANADADPVSSVEVEETSTPMWIEAPADQVASKPPSSRRPRLSRPAPSPVPRGTLGALGFGRSDRRAKGAATPARREFVGLALLTLGALVSACWGPDIIGGGGGAGVGGDDGGGPDGGYDAGDGGPGAGGGGGAGGATTTSSGWGTYSSSSSSGTDGGAPGTAPGTGEGTQTGEGTAGTHPGTADGTTGTATGTATGDGTTGTTPGTATADGTTGTVAGTTTGDGTTGTVAGTTTGDGTTGTTTGDGTTGDGTTGDGTTGDGTTGDGTTGDGTTGTGDGTTGTGDGTTGTGDGTTGTGDFTGTGTGDGTTGTGDGTTGDGFVRPGGGRPRKARDDDR